MAISTYHPQILHMGVPEDMTAFMLTRLSAEQKQPQILVCAESSQCLKFKSQLNFYMPQADVHVFPAWDCLPYDRVSPQRDVMAARLSVLARLAKGNGECNPQIILTTESALMQRLMPRASINGLVLGYKIGDKLTIDDLSDKIVKWGYTRTGTVYEPGEFAVRGGIIDIFPAGSKSPIRIDLFGDKIESLKLFDPVSQTTTGKTKSFEVVPASEVLLNAGAIDRFRMNYLKAFGSVSGDDSLYAAVVAGQLPARTEHYLPLFYDKTESLLDYAPEANIIFAHRALEALDARQEQIEEYYDARREFDVHTRENRQKQPGILTEELYHPLPTNALYLLTDDLKEVLKGRQACRFAAFQEQSNPEFKVIEQGGRKGYAFISERKRSDSNLFDHVADWIKKQQKDGLKVCLAVSSQGAQERLLALLTEHGLEQGTKVESWDAFKALSKQQVGVSIMDMPSGYQTDEVCFITEQDIFGEQFAQRPKKAKQAKNFIRDVSALATGDIVVHVEHGLGRYLGLEMISVGAVSYDCVKLEYSAGDKLLLPVEHLERLSRYGADEGFVNLDKLGGASWSTRKERVRKRILEMAEKLMGIAAAREIAKGPVVSSPGQIMEDFCARFPYIETEDQMRAIEETLQDLCATKPMDRLICGDVGFGKTEVALRAAFVAAMSGLQVAVVVPTTLLARQHYKTFIERIRGFPIKVAQLSRLVKREEVTRVKKMLASGDMNIVIGTHALLAKSMNFSNLGLLIVDEEQHFGVGQKERLKDLKKDVHVLSMSATPIPRTLQLALSGVRDLSLISTPPVDRMAVRTFVAPFDAVAIREAIRREKFRGGKVFYVCPRIKDLSKVQEKLTQIAPDIKYLTASGQLSPGELEETMTAFCDGPYDLLLSTSIVESGLDIATANTMIIHRADQFGLGQLYQLRGRVGRGKARGYCYMTYEGGKRLTETAQKRFEVMQTLDHLGAGFTLASHDLDIRGAGNLVGQDQSGHVKDVGIELYQTMLRDAVEGLRHSGAEAVIEDAWSPAINLGVSVLIPESYITDLGLRMSLYRRLAEFRSMDEIEPFKVEMIDRFGPIPTQVNHFLNVIELKILCLQSGVEKVDIGAKGAVIGFYKNSFAAPEELIAYLGKQSGTIRIRPQDQRLVVHRAWASLDVRIAGIKSILQDLVDLL